VPAIAMLDESAPQGRAAAPVPELRYQIPPDFVGQPGAGTYIAINADGIVQVYDFRPFPGDLGQEFPRTLLRDWIAPENREERLMAPPLLQTTRLAGADQVFGARFQQSDWGMARERFRLAILASHAVAIVDINIRDASAWQRYQPSILALLSSLAIGAAAPPAVTSSAGSEVRGLWLANKLQFQPNLLGGVGSGSWQMGTEFYLLSDDGRVYRGRRLPSAANGDIRRFDFDAAAREDPANSGRYGVKGNQVIIRLGNAPYETITADLVTPDTLRIYDVSFERALRQ
jgi:hypothetical protein